MTLSSTVASASAGAIGFDTAVPLDTGRATGFARRGYRFCVRYISRTDESRRANAVHGCADLSEAEARTILDAGMALMAVQHVAAKGWTPSAGLGAQYGANASRFCQEAGLPPGVNVWLDLEEIPQSTAHTDTLGYANAWFGEVATAGYVPGVYVGCNSWLSPDELFLDLHCRHYWRAAGHIQDVLQRGYQLFQHVTSDVGGQELDRNVATPDALGGTAMWLVA